MEKEEMEGRERDGEREPSGRAHNYMYLNLKTCIVHVHMLILYMYTCVAKCALQLLVLNM